MSDVASLFLKLTGKKPGAFVGEVESDGYEGQIAIDDWTWSLNRPPDDGKESAAPSTGQRSNNAAVPSVLAFGKLMCKASANMLKAMESGELLKAVITLEEDSDVDFELVVTLERVRIIEYSVSVAVSETSGKLDENWTLNYESVSFDYVSSGSGGKVSMKPPLKRLAGAPTDKVPTSTEAGMKEMAKKLVEEAGGKIKVGDLVAKWQQIVEEAEKDYKPGRVKANATSKDGD